MSIRYKNVKLASANTYHPDLFDVKWSDHIIDNISWLRADTFSWQIGSVYQRAYEHLVKDINALRSADLICETIEGIAIYYYSAHDGHKIVEPTQERAVQEIYEKTGIAWYYILDTTNHRFKLPRTKYAFTGVRNDVGKYVEAGLPNITGITDSNNNSHTYSSSDSGAFYKTEIEHAWYGDNIHNYIYNTGFDASLSNPIYGNSDTVQPQATEMYLYFYVGNYTQSALENTAGLNISLFNNKVDIGHQVIDFQAPTALNDYTWYRKYADGWVEQGGRVLSTTIGYQVTLPITMSDANYTTITTGTSSANSQPSDTNTANRNTAFNYSRMVYDIRTTSFKVGNEVEMSQNGFCWQVSGMAA